MSRARIVLLSVLIIVVIVIVAQNTDSVSTRLLFVTVTMPRALLLVVTFLAGTAIGLLLSMRKKRKPEETA